MYKADAEFGGPTKNSVRDCSIKNQRNQTVVFIASGNCEIAEQCKQFAGNTMLPAIIPKN